MKPKLIFLILLIFLGIALSAFFVWAQNDSFIIREQSRPFSKELLGVNPKGEARFTGDLTGGGTQTILGRFDRSSFHWLITSLLEPQGNVLGFRNGSSDIQLQRDLFLGDRLVFNSQDNDWALFDEATSDFDSSGSQENKLDLRLYLLDDLDDSQKFSIWGGSCAGPDRDITTPADNNCADPLASTKQHEFTADGKAWIRDSLKVEDSGLSSGMLSQSGLGAFDAAKAIDRNLISRAWNTDSSSTGAWLKIDLGSGNDKAYIKTSIYAESDGYKGNYKIQYSDDDTTWKDAATNFIPSAKGWNEKKWNSVGSHRYWRLQLTNTPGAGSWLNELVMHQETVEVGNILKVGQDIYLQDKKWEEGAGVSKCPSIGSDYCGCVNTCKGQWGWASQLSDCTECKPKPCPPSPKPPPCCVESIPHTCPSQGKAIFVK